MYNQNFSTKELVRYLQLSDLKEHKITKAKVEIELEITCKAINDGTFNFTIHKNGLVFYTDRLADILVLRKLNDNIKRLYKDEQANRRVIINQVTTLLPDCCDFWILKTDISKFYESVDRTRILGKLENDSRLSYFTLWLIKRIFSHASIEPLSGLPRGIGVSATLSEIYMRKFDRYIRGRHGVYYYSRFVDDILIFSHNREALYEIQNKMNDNLEKGLAQNQTKTRIYDGNNISVSNSLEYLGYKFSTKKNGKGKNVTISIADKKVKKIKTRLVLSFISYLKDSDFTILEKRIRFLCGNYSIKSANGNEHDLKAGIYYNYLHINDLSALKELNDFYHRLLHARNGTLGQRLSAKLTIGSKDQLKKYSFKNGFENKVYHKFNFAVMKKIKESWRHE